MKLRRSVLPIIRAIEHQALLLLIFGTVGLFNVSTLSGQISSTHPDSLSETGDQRGFSDLLAGANGEEEISLLDAVPLGEPALVDSHPDFWIDEPPQCITGLGSLETDEVALPPADFYRLPNRSPDWLVQASAAALSFEPEQSVTVPVGTGGVPLSTGTFRPRFDAGLDASIRHHFAFRYFWEARYLGGIETTQTAPQATSGPAILSRQGRFDRAECFLGHRLPSSWTAPFLPTHIDALLGFRFIRLDDQLNGAGTVATENRLFGAAGGFRSFTYHSPSILTQLDITGGIYGINASGFATGGTLPREELQLDETAFAGSLSAKISYAFNRHWHLRLGYQVELLSNIVSADSTFAENVNKVSFAMQADQNALLHGPTLGVTFVR
ncbi:MAG: hypothetical protein ACF788_06205 [Novipirellula sp. JB048]